MAKARSSGRRPCLGAGTRRCGSGARRWWPGRCRSGHRCYGAAPPAARALIEAAMDARRLGHGPALPLPLPEAATEGYLTDVEWDLLDDDWLERAVAYTAMPLRGTRGPLTRIRSRAAHRPESAQPHHRLADYLEQHGRQRRHGDRAPAAAWDALVRHAAPVRRHRLPASAARRGRPHHPRQGLSSGTRRNVTKGRLPRHARPQPHHRTHRHHSSGPARRALSKLVQRIRGPPEPGTHHDDDLAPDPQAPGTALDAETPACRQLTQAQAQARNRRTSPFPEPGDAGADRPVAVAVRQPHDGRARRAGQRGA